MSIKPVVRLSCNALGCDESAIIPIRYTEAAAALLGLGIPELPEGWEVAGGLLHECPRHNAIDRVFDLLREGKSLRVELTGVIGSHVSAGPHLGEAGIVGVTRATFGDLTVREEVYTSLLIAAQAVVEYAGWRDVLKAVK